MVCSIETLAGEERSIGTLTLCAVAFEEAPAAPHEERVAREEERGCLLLAVPRRDVEEDMTPAEHRIPDMAGVETRPVVRRSVSPGGRSKSTATSTAIPYHPVLSCRTSVEFICPHKTGTHLV